MLARVVPLAILLEYLALTQFLKKASTKFDMRLASQSVQLLRTSRLWVLASGKWGAWGLGGTQAWGYESSTGESLKASGDGGDPAQRLLGLGS